MARHIYGYWDCIYCNSKGIKGDNRECPNCGHPRDEDVKFYIGKEKDIVPESKKNDNPDWVCQYCNSLNPSYETSCLSCGAERTNKTYFDKSKNDSPNSEYENDNIDEASNSTFCEDSYAKDDAYDDFLTSEHENDSIDETSNSAFYEEAIEDSYVKDDAYTNEKNSSENIVVNAFNNLLAFIKEYRSNILIGTSIFAAAALIIWSICYLFIPYTTTIKVDSFEWSRTIELEELRTFEENDWSLPAGAKLKYTNEEIHHYDQVIDHYEHRTRTVSRQVPDGTEVVGYRDLGNGQFEEQTRTKYKTVYEEESYEQPIYRDEPVYRTKYYYTIDRWVHWKDVKTSGQDRSPYWGEVGYLNSKQREGSRIEKYYVVSDGENYSVNYSDWNALEPGQELTVKVQRFGNKVVEIIF